MGENAPHGLHPAWSADASGASNAPTDEGTRGGLIIWAALRGCPRREEQHKSRVDCKKIHFFCKKMQIYLHMSKKSSIFAPDLGIVPAMTIKNV